jgi:hypothetical protein
MSNLFDQVLNGVGNVEEKYLGPTYLYYKNIKTPREIGMSDEGTLQAMGRDINGLIQYVELLVTGKSQASATGGPLGNKFFLQTGAKCAATNKCSNPKDTSTCEKVDRYIYVNNVPAGNIPFISQGLGVNFSEFKGLIPGTMSNLNTLNPLILMQSFLSGSNPACQEITMETINTDNLKSSETHYVTLTDIKNMDPCSFRDGKNPLLPNSRCKETFETGVAANASPVLPDDPLAQIYFASLAGIGMYILYRLMEKSNSV